MYRIVAGHPQEDIAEELCIEAPPDIINDIFKLVKAYGDAHPEIIDE